LAIDHIHHADQGTGRKVSGPSTPELIVEDAAQWVVEFKVSLEVLCGMDEKPTSMSAPPMAGFMRLPRRTPKARPWLPN
jgi:hypothetical protein